MEQFRFCKKCGYEKVINVVNFNCIIRGSKFYYSKTCRDCLKKQKRDYYVTNKDRLLKYQKEYFYRNKRQITGAAKEYYILNRDEILNKQKEYNECHKTERKEYNKELDKKTHYYSDYRIKNKTVLYEKRRVWERNKMQSDVSFRLKKRVSRDIWGILKKNNSAKNGISFFKYLTYTIIELKEHLEKQFESWMNWNNWGKYNSKTWDDNNQSTWTWQIDHIIPQSDLPYTSMEDDNFKKCWSLENLRPLNSKQNYLDGINRVRHE